MTKGILCVDGWAGRREIPVSILKETTSRLLIRLEKDCTLPGRGRKGVKGQEFYVPKYAIRREEIRREALDTIARQTEPAPRQQEIDYDR